MEKERKIPPFQGRLYKKNKTDKIYWVDNRDYYVGVWEFTFDKKKVYNFFRDYPHNMTTDEVKIFDKENTFLKDYFKSRKESI